MHELSVCESLMGQVRAIASDRGGLEVLLVRVRIGPLSGVEPDLLRRAFEIARAGPFTADAALEIETIAIEVACRDCGGRGPARPNRLLCPDCDSYRVQVLSGEEMLLTRVELRPAESRDPAEPSRLKEASNV